MLRRPGGAAYPRDWSLDDGDASSQEVRHAENNSGTPRTRTAGSSLCATYVLTTTRDAIFMEPRELRLRIFHLSRAARRSPLSPGTFLPTTSARLIVLVLFTSDPKLAIYGIDLFRVRRGSPREKKEESRPLRGSRSYESYATVSAADRIKNPGKKESVRPIVRESSVPLSFLS